MVITEGIFPDRAQLWSFAALPRTFIIFFA